MANGASSSDLSRVARATQALAALGQVEQLLVLDDLWTRYLLDGRGGERTERPDFEGLIVVATEMDQALAKMPEVAASVRGLLEDVPATEIPERGLELVGEGDPRLASALREILGDDRDGVPVRDALIAACAYMEEETGSEREHLYGKRLQLEEGTLPEPDLRPAYRCLATVVEIAALTTLAAAGAASVLAAPIVIGAGILGFGATLINRWEKSECGEAWRIAVERFTDERSRRLGGQAGDSA